MKKILSASASYPSWLVLFTLALLLPCSVFAQEPELPAPAQPAIAKVDFPEAPKLESKETSAATTNKPVITPSECKIRNFGKVTDQYFRGAQPSPAEYAQLAGLGVKTVIDLRNDAETFAKTKAEAEGMTYINVPLSDTVYPTKEAVQRFLELVKDQSNFPIFVHCPGGRHRTGVMTAVYRMTFEGWAVEKAYQEMKDYDFYTRFGHGEMKKFVFDYWKELQAKRKEAAAMPTATTVVP